MGDVRAVVGPEPCPRIRGTIGGGTRPAVPPGGREARETAPQIELENSQQQPNVLGAFVVDGVPAGEPVLLVDDLVDSRWTLTVVGATLLEAGSGPVSPFVLAKSVSD